MKRPALILATRGHTAVMQSRKEPPDSLDFFPTPPWATRALFHHVLNPRYFGTPSQTAWDPACGEGHMVAVLEEMFSDVRASDVFPYTPNQPVIDFLHPDTVQAQPVDWIITNPPFNVADDFARIGLQLARRGVCLLCRSAWAETSDRYTNLFQPFPLSIEALFVERVPMVKGRWDPNASSATAYSWFIWLKGHDGPTEKFWIPPGNRAALSKLSDIQRFVPAAPLPLFEES
jgi:hypothetical protein